VGKKAKTFKVDGDFWLSFAGKIKYTYAIFGSYY
jgi:hypothetical protein